MISEEAELENPIAVPCPTCRAPQGSYCRDAAGRIRATILSCPDRLCDNVRGDSDTQPNPTKKEQK